MAKNVKSSKQTAQAPLPGANPRSSSSRSSQPSQAAAPADRVSAWVRCPFPATGAEENQEALTSKHTTSYNTFHVGHQLCLAGRDEVPRHAGEKKKRTRKMQS